MFLLIKFLLDLREKLLQNLLKGLSIVHKFGNIYFFDLSLVTFFILKLERNTFIFTWLIFDCLNNFFNISNFFFRGYLKNSQRLRVQFFINDGSICDQSRLIPIHRSILVNIYFNFRFLTIIPLHVLDIQELPLIIQRQYHSLYTLRRFSLILSIRGIFLTFFVQNFPSIL